MGVNTWFLAQPTTGSGQYVRHILQAFAAQAPDEEFVLLGPASGPLGPNQRAHVLGARGDAGKVWLEQAGVPLAAWREKVQLIHYPYFAAPLVSPVPVVVTVHDLIPLMPDYRGPAKVRAYTRLAVEGTRRAVMVLTDSDASRRDIVERLGVLPERVRVVYLGVEACYRPEHDPALAAGVRRKYNLRRDFVLYLGGLDARKNVPALLRAFARARDQLCDPPELVIAGPRPEATDLPALAQRLELAASVRFLGAVEETEKPILYGVARLFVFPSFYEGFGLPPLEAMACGTPVVCSNASSLPEVIGDAGLLVDPADEDALAEAMCRALEDRALAARLRSAGPARAAQFTWERTGRETLAVYREVLGR
ncbi:MAG: glycosyltransferase family 4 protein [Bacteroidetes bacterium]|nr:glycosyltransferase family 4 protein [Bacteroidota bacterium]MCL5026290.1 glycosyltransferase family 4 protein [Chloroflexota bacterium]